MADLTLARTTAFIIESRPGAISVRPPMPSGRVLLALASDSILTTCSLALILLLFVRYPCIHEEPWLQLWMLVGPAFTSFVADCTSIRIRNARSPCPSEI